MSNVLTDARVGLAAALVDAGLPAYTTAPEDPAPDDDEFLDDDDQPTSAYPLIYVVPWEPYVDWPDGTFGGQAVMHLNVSVVSAAGLSDTEAEQVDGLLVDAVAALTGIEDWHIVQVLQPGKVTINNDAHLACAIECVRSVTLAG